MRDNGWATAARGLAIGLTVAAVAAQSKFVAFGAPCPNGAGLPRLAIDRLPSLGDSFTLRCAPVPSGRLGSFYLGTSRTQWQGRFLPWALDPLGMPGCWLRIGPSSNLPGAPGVGSLQLSVAVPPSSALLGQTLYWQVAHEAPGANSAGLAWSDGAATTFGPAPETVRVVSYNVFHCEGADRRVDIPRTAAVLTRSRADIAILQEVDRGVRRSGGGDQFAELMRLTGWNGVFGKAIPYQGGDFGNVVLTRFPIRSSRIHRLPNPQAVEPRIVLDVVVATPSGGDLRVLATHFDPIGEPTQSQAVAVIEQLVQGSATPTVLGGDLNASPPSAVVTRLRRQFLDVSEGRDHKTAPALIPVVQIDYVMAWPRARFRTVNSLVIPEPIASDHRPVQADIELRR